MASFGAVYEDEDNWLVNYLASTEYGTDSRINSNPIVIAPKKAPKKEKKAPLYNLTSMLGSNNARRNSWTASIVKNKQRNSFQEVVGLPDRVNAVREASSVNEGNMVIREHGKVTVAQVPEGAKRSSIEEDEEAWADAELSKVRRQSLDYDELEAVKERVMQATSLWNKSGASRPALETAPVITSKVVPVEIAPVPVKTLNPSPSGKNWLIGKWLSKFGGNKSRVG